MAEELSPATFAALTLDAQLAALGRALEGVDGEPAPGDSASQDAHPPRKKPLTPCHTARPT